MWEGGSCACRTAMSSSNSRCREMADALERGDGNQFMRLWSEWGDDGAIAHIACVDAQGSTWTHVAARMGLVDIVCFLLQRAPSVIETIDQRGGKLIAYAMERN